MRHRPFRFGVVAAQARSGAAWIAAARRAEELGYATWLIPDTLGPTLAPLPALAYVAAATSTLRVGTYVLANGYRNPVLVAREAATIDMLSDGRFELGLGAGRPHADEDWRKLGLPVASGRTRVAQLAEALQIIKGVLSGERVTASGPHYAAAAADVFPRPVQQPRPPILIAAGGPRLLALAAREADSIAIAAMPTAGEATFAELVETVRAAAGERFTQIELNINLIAVGAQVPPWIAQRMGLDVDQLLRSGSPAVLLGGTDEMCEQLERRRETLGISYITVSDAMMEQLAPVVEQLAGR